VVGGLEVWVMDEIIIPGMSVCQSFDLDELRETAVGTDGGKDGGGQGPLMEEKGGDMGKSDRIDAFTKNCRWRKAKRKDILQGEKLGNIRKRNERTSELKEAN